MAITAGWDSDDSAGCHTEQGLGRMGTLMNRQWHGLRAGVSQQLSRVLTLAEPSATRSRGGALRGHEV